MAFARKSESQTLGWEPWSPSASTEPWASTLPYRRVLSWMQARPGDVLLDLGCASGRMLDYATRMDLKATGLEFSPQAAAVAQKSASEAVVFIGTMDELPFEDASFHHVTSLGLPTCLYYPERHLQEIHRVLKSGGRACLRLAPRAAVLDVGAENGELLEGLGRQPLSPTFAEWERLATEKGYRIRGVGSEHPLHDRNGVTSAMSRRGYAPWQSWWWRAFPRWHRQPFLMVLEKLDR